MAKSFTEVLHFISEKTLEEKKNLHTCQKDVDKKNALILQTIVFAISLILGICFILSCTSNLFNIAGISALRWVFLAVSLLCCFFFLYIKHAPSKHITAMIYIVNALAFAYSFYVSVFVAPESIGISFIIVLFMFSTLFLDYGWRIHLFMTIITVIFIVGTSFFKTPETHMAESINAIIVLLLMFLIGTIVRSAHLDSFVLENTLKKYAYYDILTGVHNRRKLFEDLAKFESPDSVHKIAALSILDIDYFKQYNDTYGHLEGDICLKKIGKCFLRLEEKYSIRCYRYGGEEFAIAFINCTKEQVREYATAIINAIRVLAIPHAASNHHIITASLGIAFVPSDEDTKFEYVLSLSDKALYEAKENGRNKLLFSDTSISVHVQQLSTIRQR